MAVCTTSARCVNVAQPHPCSPGWSVITFTTTRRMLLGAVRTTFTSLMRIGGSPRGAAGGVAGARRRLQRVRRANAVNKPAPAASGARRQASAMRHVVASKPSPALGGRHAASAR